jgi:serine protease Do
MGHRVFGATNKVPIFISRNAVPENALSAHPEGFAPILKPALPAVVNIASSRVVKMPESPFLNDPFLQRFFGMPGRPPATEQRQHGLGSGVIVSPDGYILTNNHVVENATEIKVVLPDKREFRGKVVGTDPKTDVAVVKISATGLPTLTLGDSSKVEVGDYALAIGDPFGIGETATMGIVSATGRGNLDIEDYEDFVQTDAAINPGNSGGALINARSELIGINTAILAGESGGNQGIGFAIPINMARYVMEAILKNGKVVRGYLGVAIQEVTPDLAKAFNVPQEKGALIGDVTPGGPAAKAGLQKGDVIEELNGEPIKGPNELKLKIASLAPGSVARLKINRSGQERTVSVTLGELPEKATENAPGSAGESSPIRGVQVDDLTPDVARELGLRPDTKGVVVTDVDPGAPAADAGLRRGDAIQEVNRQPVSSVSEFQSAVRRARKQPLVLSVNRQGSTAYIVIQPEKISFAIPKVKQHLPSDLSAILDAQQLAAAVRNSCSPYIELRNVSIAFGQRPVLGGVSFGVMPGQSVCIMGRSGVGKSVCLRLIMGFLKPDAGSVITACKEITEYSEDQLREIHKKVTMVFQNGALFDSLTVAENVAFPLRERGNRDEEDICRTVEQVLDTVGAKDIADYLTSDISTGMKRSVAIARALTLGPEAVLYDEPTTMVDPLTARRLSNLIRELKTRLNLTTVVVTHDTRLAEKIADQVIFLDQGKVVFSGRPAEMERSSIPLVRQFLELDRIRLSAY